MATLHDFAALVHDVMKPEERGVYLAERLYYLAEMTVPIDLAPIISGWYIISTFASESDEESVRETRILYSEFVQIARQHLKIEPSTKLLRQSIKVWNTWAAIYSLNSSDLAPSNGKPSFSKEELAENYRIATRFLLELREIQSVQRVSK
jgi:hypothetical protein